MCEPGIYGLQARLAAVAIIGLVTKAAVAAGWLPGFRAISVLT